MNYYDSFFLCPYCKEVSEELRIKGEIDTDLGVTYEVFCPYCGEKLDPESCLIEVVVYKDGKERCVRVERVGSDWEWKSSELAEILRDIYDAKVMIS